MYRAYCENRSIIHSYEKQCLPAKLIRENTSIPQKDGYEMHKNES